MCTSIKAVRANHSQLPIHKTYTHTQSIQFLRCIIESATEKKKGFRLLLNEVSLSTSLQEGHSETRSRTTKGRFTRLWIDPQYNKETNVRWPERSGWLITVEAIQCFIDKQKKSAYGKRFEDRWNGLSFLSPYKSSEWAGTKPTVVYSAGCKSTYKS